MSVIHSLEAGSLFSRFFETEVYSATDILVHNERRMAEAISAHDILVSPPRVGGMVEEQEVLARALPVSILTCWEMFRKHMNKKML